MLMYLQVNNMIPYEEIVKNTSYYINILRNGRTYDDQIGMLVSNKEIIRKISGQINLYLMRPYSLLRCISLHIRGFDGLEVDKVDADAIRYEILNLI